MFSEYSKVDLFWILPIIFCFLAIFPMDYGYYMLMRLVIFVCAIYYIVILKETSNNLIWIFVGFAILYNPILPIYLKSKFLWVIINLITLYFFYINRSLVKK